MAPEAILRILQETFADEVVELVPEGVHPHAVVKPERWHDIALFLRDDERLGFDWLRSISGVDHIEDKLLTAVYDLHATGKPDQPGELWHVRNEIAVKVRADRDNPHIPSVADVWPTANWHEREAYDLLGITFDGHPDLRRILCCDDWVGHPLRKDYEFPAEYHGIPGIIEDEQTRPRH
jgi:NADH-quinone oxidoreductase subunit C